MTTFTFLAITLGIVIIINLILIMPYIKQQHSLQLTQTTQYLKQNKRRNTIIKITTGALVTTMWIILLCIALIGQHHGSKLNHNNIATTLKYALSNNILKDGFNIEEELPENLAKCIILTYKTNDKTSEDVFAQINPLHKGVKDDVYWVNIDSEQGKEFTKKFFIDFVPSVIYVYSDSVTSSFEKAIYEDGTPNIAAFERAFTTQKKEKGIIAEPLQINE